MPFLQHAASIGEVIDGIEARDGIERPVIERQRPAGIDMLEANAPLNMLIGGHLVCVGDAMFVDVYTGHIARRSLRDEYGRAAGTGCNFKKAGSPGQAKHADELPHLVRGQPAVLPDVLAVRLPPDLFHDGICEVTVGGIIVIDAVCHG